MSNLVLTRSLGHQLSIYGIVDLNFCNCGAWSFTTIEGDSFSVLEKNIPIVAPYLSVSELNEYKETNLNFYFSCCNHCSNHWGLDLDSEGYGEEISIKNMVKMKSYVSSYACLN